MTDDSPASKDDIPRVLRLVSQVVAPATLVTALLYFFGRQRTLAFYDHFGVAESTLGLSTTDYLLVAQDGLFVPLVVVTAGVLVALWARRLRRRPSVAPSAWVVGAVGAVAGLLVLFGLVQMVRPGLGVAAWVPRWVAPLGFVAGVLGVWWAVRVRAPAPRTIAESVTVFLLVSAGLFWAVANYSVDVGRARALEYQAQLPTVPGVVVLSTADLQLSGPGVLARECGADGDFRFRYDGYVLMLEAGGDYLLVPRRWTPATGYVSAVPATDDVRLDFQNRAAVGSVERC